MLYSTQERNLTQPSPTSTDILSPLSRRPAFDYVAAQPLDPVKNHLLTLSRQLFATINGRESLSSISEQNGAEIADSQFRIGDSYSGSIRHHLAPDMSIEHADAPVYSSSNLLDHFKGMTSAHPNISVEVQNASVQVEGRYASVWCWLEIGGLSSDATRSAQRREAIAVLLWEQVEAGPNEATNPAGRWICTRHQGLRGMVGV